MTNSNDVDDFLTTYAIVKGRVANKLELNAKEKLMLGFIQIWNSTK